jgi:hypothetical protein
MSTFRFFVIENNLFFAFVQEKTNVTFFFWLSYAVFLNIAVMYSFRAWQSLNKTLRFVSIYIHTYIHIFQHTVMSSFRFDIESERNFLA